MKKIMVAFVMQYYKMNHVIYHQGQSPNSAFIVAEGEFEITKTIVKKTKQVQTMNLKNKYEIKSPKNNQIQVRIAILTKGQILGFEDIIQ